MSVPADPAVLAELDRVVKENEEAGDWLGAPLPDSVVPLQVNKTTGRSGSSPRPRKEGQ